MSSRFARLSRAVVPFAVLSAAACADGGTSPQRESGAPAAAPAALQAVQCTAEVRTGVVACRGTGALADGARGAIIGGQRTYVTLRSTNLTYTPADSLLSFDVTIENLLNEDLGTVDGVTPDSAGVRIFFSDDLMVVGRGSATVNNADGTRTFTSAEQPFFQYDEILSANETSQPRRWAFKIEPEVQRVLFVVYVAAQTERQLVINEFMPNPGGTVQDSVGEYVELYNAGTLEANLRGFILSDNTAGVADTIKTDLVVPAGGYVLLGRSANTSKNGGITPDYLYTTRVGPTSTSLTFSNSGSDFFRVRAPGGVTVDSVFYSSGTTTAVAGVARELRNPSLDNQLADGASWGAATPFYDTPNANRGTPGAQNSNFTP
jgi:Lamin Tail Domain